jgi:hypothetical protein
MIKVKVLEEARTNTYHEISARVPHQSSARTSPLTAMNYGMIATGNHYNLLRCALPQPSGEAIAALPQNNNLP